MRKFNLTVLVFLAIASVAWSQAPSKVNVYLGGGIAFPTAPKSFTDGWKMGFNGFGGVGVSVTQSLWAIVSIDYTSFPLDNDYILKSVGTIPSNVNVNISGGTASCLNLSGGLKTYFSSSQSSANPYAIIDAGYFNLSASDVIVKATMGSNSVTMTVKTDSENAFSASAGFGVDIPAGETIGIFIEARYFIAFTKGESTGYIPVKAGILFRL